MNLSPPTDKQAEELGVLRTELRRYVMATVTKSNYSMIPPPTMLMREDGGYLTAVSAGQAQRSAEGESIIRVLQVIDGAGSALTARQLEVQYGGVKNETRLSKQRLRDVLKRAIEGGFLDGADRQPLVITALGTDILRTLPPSKKSAPAAGAVAPKADAMRCAEVARPEKVL